MKNKRLIAIGDIHGEITKLESLIENLHLQNGDKLIFLGDYIDRGLFSKQVVDKVIELSKYYECEFLMGNHEYNMMRASEGDEKIIPLFYINGGYRTVDNYGDIENILKIHGDFYTNLKYYYLTDDFLFVHAGIHPQKPLEDQEEFKMLTIRDDFINHKHILKQKVIFGHTPFETPHVEDDKIGIDTGCGKYPDAPLTAYICNENKFVTSD